MAVIPQPGAGYRVFRFDAPAQALAEDWYLAQEEILNSEQHAADTVEDAEQVLRGMRVDPSVLDAPWISDYPL